MTEALHGLGAVRTTAHGVADARGPAAAERFDAVLARGVESSPALAFSGHASRRLEQRGVEMDEGRMRRLQSAVERAEAKGSRDSLILLDDLALVVSIENHTVVTAVDEASQKERVFTNIDSVVIAE